MIIYDRKTDTARRQQFEPRSPSGGYGQISFSHLCDLLESTRETSARERITHLVIKGAWVGYVMEPKT